MAVPMRRPGRVVDYFIEGGSVVTHADQTEATVEDGAQELRCLAPLLPPSPRFLNRRAQRRRQAIAFGVSLLASSALLILLARVVVR